MIEKFERCYLNVCLFIYVVNKCLEGRHIH